MDELRGDSELLEQLRSRLAANPRRNPEPLLGKRRALYCMVRAERPALVAESGVHDGLGSSVLLRALERNAEAGSSGALLAFDINPEAGWLIDRERHSRRLQLVIGNTRETLEESLAGRTAGLFIHDSLKTHEHETYELETAARVGVGRRVLYTDDLDSTGAMRRVCARHGGSCSSFTEVPARHHWRGNKLGLCLLDGAG